MARTPHPKPTKGKKATRKNTSCQCTKCGRWMYRPYDLKRHEKAKHGGVHDYICEWEGCTYKAHQKSNFEDHMNTHTGEKPHECNFECGDAFGNRGNRTHHHKRCPNNPNAVKSKPKAMPRSPRKKTARAAPVRRNAAPAAGALDGSGAGSRAIDELTGAVARGMDLGNTGESVSPSRNMHDRPRYVNPNSWMPTPPQDASSGTSSMASSPAQHPMTVDQMPPLFRAYAQPRGSAALAGYAAMDARSYSPHPSQIYPSPSPSAMSRSVSPYGAQNPHAVSLPPVNHLLGAVDRAYGQPTVYSQDSRWGPMVNNAFSASYASSASFPSYGGSYNGSASYASSYAGSASRASSASYPSSYAGSASRTSSASYGSAAAHAYYPEGRYRGEEGTQQGHGYSSAAPPSSYPAAYDRAAEVRSESYRSDSQPPRAYHSSFYPPLPNQPPPTYQGPSRSGGQASSSAGKGREDASGQWVSQYSFRPVQDDNWPQ